MEKLRGQAVVVTGGGSGIGAACVQDLLDHGADVVINDLDPILIEKQLDLATNKIGKAVGCVGDVSDAESAQNIITKCIQSFGKIDGLVNNAGIMFVGSSAEMDPSRAQKLVEVNVLGTIYCGVAAMREMLNQNSGSIVNVTSGAHMGLPNTAIYGASKGAVASLTYDWATDLQSSGVRVNAISPMANTRMAEDVLRLRSLSSEDISAALATFPTPEANAPVVTYLLSDLSGDLTGQIVRIDGDELSLISRPSILHRSVANVEWTLGSVSRAFEETLSRHALPLGFLKLQGNYKFTPVENHRLKDGQ